MNDAPMIRLQARVDDGWTEVHGMQNLVDVFVIFESFVLHDRFHGHFKEEIRKQRLKNMHALVCSPREGPAHF